MPWPAGPRKKPCTTRSPTLQTMKERVEAENVSLRQDLQLWHGHPQILGRSPTLQKVLAQAEKVAATDASVLLLGETGTGKELVAAAIHDLSPRRDRPMVRVNCAAIPSNLIESELFGREKGAYTGALSKQIGRFEAAHGSTIFLDEIGELPPEVQVKLLRVLQEKQIERLGNPTPISVDVRIISATNCDLAKAVRAGKFREDLYYRLNVFPIRLPPLRERPEDIPILVSAFVEQFNVATGHNITSIPKSTLDALQHYHWPGNVRELRNVIERAVILGRGPKLAVELPGLHQPPGTPSLLMKDVERDHILRGAGADWLAPQGQGRGRRDPRSQAHHAAKPDGQTWPPPAKTLGPIYRHSADISALFALRLRARLHPRLAFGPCLPRVHPLPQFKDPLGTPPAL